MFEKQVVDSVFDMEVPPRASDGSMGKLVIVGDTHGHLEDFLYVIAENGEPSDRVHYLMNGDIADRGFFASEILIICLIFKQLYPNAIMINRGNHENMEINRRRSEEGGGFYDEVMYKYSSRSSDQAVFYMFQQLFELLPLATVVSKKVFVVHGGLFRHEQVTLNDIRKLSRRRQCPTTTAKKEDAMMFDTMWADPHEINGVMRSQRGPNCIRFGPDVTERFLRNNHLNLVVRSHEVPMSNHGFEEMHHKRLVTLFTASDYCGYTGNSGAVLVLNSDLSYVLLEHMAWMRDGEFSNSKLPDRPEYWCYEGEAINPSGARERSFDEPRAPTSPAGRSRTEIEKNIAAKLKTQVMVNKDALFQYWSRADTGRPVPGRVSLSLWQAGICKVLDLGDNLPWDEVQELILERGDMPDHNSVDYRRFITSCTQAVTKPSSGSINEEVKRQVINKFYETIIRSDFTLRETLSKFDRDGDGQVSVDELRQYLYEAHSDLPEVQIDAILRGMSLETGQALTLDKFLSRFQVVYKDSNAGRLPKEITSMLTEVGRRLLKHGSRVEVFERIDQDGNGYVEEREFSMALDQMGLPFSPAQKAALWRAIDINGDGHLNFVEFCSSFEAQGGSSADGSMDDAGREVWESIMVSLKRNTMSLDHIWRTLDPRNTGRVPKAHFKDGFRALNSSLVGRRVLTDDQLDVIVEYLDKDKDGTIDYSEWSSCYN